MLSPGSSTLSSNKTLRVLEVNYRNDPRWEAFVRSHPDAVIYHHPGWLAALESEYGQKCVSLACENESGQLRAVLPLFYTKGLPLRLGRMVTGRRLSSLPRTPIAGPLAMDREAAATIVRFAIKLASSQPGVQLEIKSHFQGLDELVNDLCCMPWRSTYIEELPPAVEGASWEAFWENTRLPRSCGPCKGCRRLRFGNAQRQHRVNWAVNKAIKLGLEVREGENVEDLAKWYSLYLLTMRDNAVPPRPYRFFQGLWCMLRPGGKMRLLVAEQNANGQRVIVAGSIFLQFGQTVFHAFTGCAPEDFCRHPHDIIQMQAIRDACKCGFRWYDLGEVTEDHEALAQFKTKWGGKPSPLYRYYYPALVEQSPPAIGRLTSSARRVWRTLSPRATEVLGDFIYRYM